MFAQKIKKRAKRDLYKHYGRFISEKYTTMVNVVKKVDDINMKKSKTLNDHQKDIEDIIIKKKGRIIGSEWRYIGKNKRKTPYFLIECKRDCGYDCDEKHEFWRDKYELKPSKRHPEGKWCPYKIINKSLNHHQMDIEPIVKRKGGKILNSEWRYIGRNNKKKPYFLIECGGDNENNEKHQWWVEKNKIKGSKSNPEGTWCNECPRGKTLEEHKRDIEPIVKRKGGKILNSEWRYNGKSQKYLYFYIECGGDNEYNITHQFWIYKNDLIPDKNHLEGVWCRECQNKTLDQHQKEIEEYVEGRGGTIIDSEWRYVNQGKYKAKIPHFYIECDNEEEKHRWWVSKGNLLPKTSNPTGSWCKVCNNRIRAVSEYVHIIIEYYSLIYLNLKNCNGRHEDILDEGSRPDLIIERDDNFKSNIEPHQNIISFSNNVDLTNIEEIAVDFTMSLIPSNIIRKCFRNYQNKERYLLIVLIREEGIVTAQYIQDLINIDAELDNEEKELIKVINFDEFLQFLNLDIKLDLLSFNKWNSLSEEIREIILMYQKTIKLSIDAIESSCALEELIKLSEKYSKLLGIEFVNQENEELSNTLKLDNFFNQPSNNYNICNFNQKDNKFQCSRIDLKKKRDNNKI